MFRIRIRSNPVFFDFNDPDSDPDLDPNPSLFHPKHGNLFLILICDYLYGIRNTALFLSAPYLEAKSIK